MRQSYPHRDLFAQPASRRLEYRLYTTHAATSEIAHFAACQTHWAKWGNSNRSNWLHATVGSHYGVLLWLSSTEPGRQRGLEIGLYPPAGRSCTTLAVVQVSTRPWLKTMISEQGWRKSKRLRPESVLTKKNAEVLLQHFQMWRRSWRGFWSKKVLLRNFRCTDFSGKFCLVQS